PDSDHIDSDIGTPGQRGDGEDCQIGIAARGDQAQAAVEALPDMHVELEPQLEPAFLESLQDVTGDDHLERYRILWQREPGWQAHNPRPPPEGRMQQVDRVIEYVTELRGVECHSCQLAIDRVEESHPPGGNQAPAIVAMPEGPHRHQYQYKACAGDHV